MRSPTNDSNGVDASSDAVRAEEAKEALFGDRRYVRERLRALRSRGEDCGAAEKQAVREALAGWRWI